MALDPQACYQALLARDPRFDGRLFVAVETTGIYCRPVCPAAPAKFENCRFFASAAAAQEAGFRPCLRCRPEVTHELGSFWGTSSTVARALALIADGALDGGEGGVDGLAEQVGIGERQLRRLFEKHVGASPAAVARTRRVLFAKQLLHETDLPMTEVALAAGFGSIRQFNATFQALFQRAPSALRRSPVPAAMGNSQVAGVTVRLRYRPPYDWQAAVGHLAQRAIPGVESVSGKDYRRVIAIGGAVGVLGVAHDARRSSLLVTLRLPNIALLSKAVVRVRRMFDLDADVGQIVAHLGRDPLLVPLLAARPGLRVIGGWDGFEVAVRAVLGQQVTLQSGRALVVQLVELCSATELSGDGAGEEAGLRRPFPTPREVLACDLAGLRMPSARKRTLAGLAQAAVADPQVFAAGACVEDTIARLQALHGVGDWTASYIALRGAQEPDAFPAGDAALLRSVAEGGVRLSAVELRAHAERWRPWRGYAAQHLWAADAVRRPSAGHATQARGSRAV